MRLMRNIALGLLAPAAVIIAYAAWTAAAPSPFFPPITRIAEKFGDLWLFERFGSDVVPSLVNFVSGYAIALCAGLIAGVIIGRVEWIREMFQPLLNLARSIPPLMLIPPLVLVLGIGDVSKIVIIAFGASFPVCLATIDGLRHADPARVDMARAIGLGRMQTLSQVYLPGAGPSIFGGAQVALQVALILMVSTEMVAAFRGLGFITMQAQLSFDALTMWAGIVLLAIIGFGCNLLFSLARRRVLRWHVGMNALSAAR